MRLADHYRTDVVQAAPEADVRELVEKMSRFGVGSVVIAGEDGRPVGIVTDRDLACRVIAEGRNPAEARAVDVMSKPVVTVSPQDRLEHVIERMRSGGIRRLPVVEDDRLVGIVALDDVLMRLSRELDDLCEAARGAVDDARSGKRWEHRRADAERALRELVERLESKGGELKQLVTREIEALRDRLRRMLE
jgi:CBS domain-containing protein